MTTTGFDASAQAASDANGQAAAAAERCPAGQEASGKPAAGTLPSDVAGALSSLQSPQPPTGLVLLNDPGVLDALDRLEEQGFGGMEGGTEIDDINDVDANLGSQMPLIKLQQKEQTEDGLQVGLFTHTVSLQQFDVLNCTLLGLKFSRQWLDKYDPKDTTLKVICASSDGKSRDWPDDRSSRPEGAPAIGHLCGEENCSHAKWYGREAPDCSEVYSLLLWIHDIDEPAVMLIRRTGVKPFRSARQQIKAMGIREQARFGMVRVTNDPDDVLHDVVRPGPHGATIGRRIPRNLLVSFRIRTRLVPGGGSNPYYVPLFSDFRPLRETHPEMLAQVVQAASMFVPAFAELRAEEVQAGDDVEPGEGTASSAGAGHPDINPSQFDDDDDEPRF